MKLTNSIDANSNKIINLPDATTAQEPVTLAQLNSAVQGWAWKSPVRAATTANITLSGLQTVDGVSLASNDRVLVKNQTTATDNGIYVVASGTWSRASDMDSAPEFLLATCFVSEGTVAGNTSWTMTTDGPIVVGSTAIVWVQTGGGPNYSAGNGITISSGVIAVDPTVTARKASAAIGDGSSTTITFTHGLNTRDIVVSLQDATTNAGVLTDWTAVTVNTVQLTFSVAPTVGQYRVIVVA